ncbi:MAG: rhomboid family intramembrane serine protease [Peptococcaceae bacterium]|nr:rhomboid family intramembrane serine protease [Peptococcaceae bacterium]
MDLKTYFKTYPVTCSFVILIVFIFLLMTLAGGSQNDRVLISFGANFYPKVSGGEYWRLITCNFLHIGIMHLVLNSVALLALGGMAESLFRKTKYVLLILLSGFFAALTSCLFHPNSISAGASGVVFGIVGAILVNAWKEPRFRASGITSSLGLLVVINLVFGFIMPYVDNAAHIGGLIAGVIVGGFYRGIRYFREKEL